MVSGLRIGCRRQLWPRQGRMLIEPLEKPRVRVSCIGPSCLWALATAFVIDEVEAGHRILKHEPETRDVVLCGRPESNQADRGS